MYLWCLGFDHWIRHTSSHYVAAAFVTCVACRRFSSITRPGAVAAPGKGKQSVAFKVQKAHRAARLAGKAISDRLTEAAAAAKKVRAPRGRGAVALLFGVCRWLFFCNMHLPCTVMAGYDRDCWPSACGNTVAPPSVPSLLHLSPPFISMSYFCPLAGARRAHRREPQAPRGERVQVRCGAGGALCFLGQARSQFLERHDGSGFTRFMRTFPASCSRSPSSLQLSDPTKLKKMSKKQLRHIKRVRINDEGVRELVPAYA